MGFWDTVKDAAGYTPIGLAYKGGKKAYDWVGGKGTETGGGQVDYDWTEADVERENQRKARAAQDVFGQQLAARARGEGPSVAQEMLKQQQQERMAAASSMAASAQGGAANRNLAGLQAMNLQHSAMGDAAAQASLLRAQEQAAAEQAYADFLMGQRGQDLSAFGAELQPVMGVGAQQADWQMMQAQLAQQEIENRRKMAMGLLEAAGGVAGMGAGGGGKGG